MGLDGRFGQEDGEVAYEEHGEVTRADDGCAGYDCVSGYGEEDQDADMDAAIACCAGGPGYGDGDEEGCEPDCWRESLCQQKVSKHKTA